MIPLLVEISYQLPARAAFGAALLGCLVPLMKAALVGFGLAAVASLVSCRGNFDAMPMDDAGMDGPPDSPPDVPLPELVCTRKTFEVESAPISGAVDLAVTSRLSDSKWEYIVGWATPADRSVTAARFGPSFAMIGAPRRLITDGATGLAGFESRPQRVWMVTTSGAQQTLWDVTTDLSSVRSVLTEASLAAVEPIAVSENPAEGPVWVRSVDSTLRLSVLQDDGAIGASSTHTLAASVEQITITDFGNHMHLAWQLASGKCANSDVDSPNNQAPVVPGDTLVGEACKGVRAVSGLNDDDSMVTAWLTAGGDIKALYTGASHPKDGAFFDITLGKGRAPKVTFDGTFYWMAWRDDTSLWLARVDKAGVIRAVALPGFVPAGDEAFELVRRGTDVDLVMHTGRKLEVLSLCAGRP